MRLTLALVCILLLATPRPAPESPSTVQGRTEMPQTAPYAVEKFGGSSNMAAGLTVPVGGASDLHTPGTTNAVRRISGTATWCAPTPRYCRNWGGKAMLGAVPSFRYGDEPYTVQVTGFHGGKANAVLVTVVSYCDCGRTVIDLSPHAFAQLAPLNVGRIRVVVDGVRSGPLPRAVPLAPQTDVEERP